MTIIDMSKYRRGDEPEPDPALMRAGLPVQVTAHNSVIQNLENWAKTFRRRAEGVERARQKAMAQYETLGRDMAIYLAEARMYEEIAANMRSGINV